MWSIREDTINACHHAVTIPSGRLLASQWCLDHFWTYESQVPFYLSCDPDPPPTCRNIGGAWTVIHRTAMSQSVMTHHNTPLFWNISFALNFICRLSYGLMTRINLKFPLQLRWQKILWFNEKCLREVTQWNYIFKYCFQLSWNPIWKNIFRWLWN